MSWKEKAITYGVTGSAVLGAIFFIGSATRMYGSRGTEVELEFSLRNEPARVMHEDIVLGPDRWWIDWNNQRFYRQEFLADDGRRITIGSSGYEVRGRTPEESH